MELIASQLAMNAGAALLLGWDSRGVILERGGRPAAVVAVALVLAAGFGVLAFAPVPVWLAVAVWAFTLLLTFLPDAFIRVTGGPTSEWSLLRDRAMLYLEIEGRPDMPIDEIVERGMRLDRYRSTTTAAYLDLYIALLHRSIPDDWTASDIEAAKARLKAMEDDLYDLLPRTPAWVGPARERLGLERR